MANITKTYYFPPNWDVPARGPLRLGSVLASTKRPLPPLLVSPVVEETQSSRPSADSEQLQVYCTTKYNLSYTTSSSYTYSAGLFASFATAVLGIGPDVSAKLSRNRALALRFARMDTQEWDPSPAELQQRVEHPSVARFLQRSRAWDRKSLFVVTGVKVAYGACAESKAEDEAEGEVKVALDPGVAANVPNMVEFGPKLGLKRKQMTDVEWETGKDGQEDPGFVFAYKVQRIKVKKRDGEVVDMRGKEYTRGALYEEDIAIEKKLDEYEIDMVGVDIKDVEADTKEEAVLVEDQDGFENMCLVPS